MDQKPSWLRWPPNCCETCEFWSPKENYFGTCNNIATTLLGEQTDSRYRCPDFHRKPDAEMEKANDPKNQDRV